MSKLTQKTLKERLSYCPDSGHFTWLNGQRTGKRAGCVRHDGYVLIWVCGKLWLAHRLVFLYMEGALPAEDVDHINGQPSDNRWLNLRHATRSINNRNQKLSTNNTSGLHGVSWVEHRKHWRAYIKLSGKHVSLGRHKTLLDAAAARIRAEKQHDFTGRRI